MKRGFSLVELVIATAISAFIVLIVYQVIDQVQRNTRQLEDTAAYCDGVIRLEQEFERTLSGMMIPGIPLVELRTTDSVPTPTAVPQEEKQASGKKEKKEEKKIAPFFAEISEGRLVRMSCVTVNPLAVYNAVSPAPVRVVYRLDALAETGGGYRLVRQELRDLMLEDRDEQKSAPIYEILDSVVSCSVRCIVPDDEKKDDTKPVYKEVAPWGMDDEKRHALLPHGVIIECTWKAGERTYTHTIFIRIPAAAWYAERVQESEKKEPEMKKAS